MRRVETPGERADALRQQGLGGSVAFEGPRPSDPETAVFPFGIDGTVSPPAGETPTFERGYAAIRPDLTALPTPQAHEPSDDGVVPAPAGAGEDRMARRVRANDPGRSEREF